MVAEGKTPHLSLGGVVGWWYQVPGTLVYRVCDISFFCREYVSICLYLERINNHGCIFMESYLKHNKNRVYVSERQSLSRSFVVSISTKRCYEV